MRIDRFGEGRAEVAVDAAVPGDEPFGSRAFGRLCCEVDPDDLDRPVDSHNGSDELARWRPVRGRAR